MLENEVLGGLDYYINSSLGGPDLLHHHVKQDAATQWWEMFTTSSAATNFQQSHSCAFNAIFCSTSSHRQFGENIAIYNCHE